MNNRITFFDTTKGILMLFLVWGHLIIFAKEFGIRTDFFPVIQYSVPFYRVFFMQTFFVITGYCTSWSASFRPFLIKNLKTIILPAFIFLPFNWLASFFVNDTCTFGTLIEKLLNYLSGGLPWFLSALFISKLLFWLEFKFVKSQRCQWITIALLFVIGLVISESTEVPNVYKFQHALLMLPFIALGNLIKGIENKEIHINVLGHEIFRGGVLSINNLALLSVPYFLIIVLWQILGLKLGFPAVDSFIDIHYMTAPFHLVFAVSGTALIFIIAKCLDGINFLSLIGRQSLFVYLFHGFVVYLLMWAYTKIFNVTDSFESGMCFYLSTYLLSILTLTIGCKIVENKKFSWMVGKF